MSEAPIPNTTPKEQFKDEVLSCCRAYMADKNSQWKARCATDMLAHFAEHVWYDCTYHEDEKTVGGRKKAKTFIRCLVKEYQCPELQMVHDAPKSGHWASACLLSGARQMLITRRLNVRS